MRIRLLSALTFVVYCVLIWKFLPEGIFKILSQIKQTNLLLNSLKSQTSPKVELVILFLICFVLLFVSRLGVKANVSFKVILVRSFFIFLALCIGICINFLIFSKERNGASQIWISDLTRLYVLAPIMVVALIITFKSRSDRNIEFERQ
jgi:hypothetical protein